jgi:arylsulfatase A-like enzyme
MPAGIRTLRFAEHVVPGVFWGLAAWSSYAVMEFIFSSVGYRLTRPYAVFTGWHWRLTVLVLAGYLLTGLAAGSLAGLAVSIARMDQRAVQPAASIGLLLALILNAAAAGIDFSSAVQAGAAFLFLLLSALELHDSRWRGKVGWVADPWMVSLAWLGIGYALTLVKGGLSSQLDRRITFAAAAMAVVIAAALAGATFVGQRWGHHAIRVRHATCATGLLLLAASFLLSLDGARVAAAQSGGFPTSQRPNLVLIVMDTVRADHLSLYGYSRNTTPRLKQLAADAVVYRNAISASDITLTSHASIFTGMYPSWHNAFSQPPGATYGRELSAQTPTLAELLRKQGYETLGVAANLYLRADFGLERGFDTFRIPRPVPMLADDNRTMLRYPLRRALAWVTETAQFDRLFAFGEEVNRELFTALDNRSRPAAPFFAFVNYMDAHYPYAPPDPYDRMFPGKRPRITQEHLGEDIDAIARGERPQPWYREHCESQYDGGIAYVDAQIGHVVDWLKQHNAYEQTMIVVTSDHGEAFGEKHRTGHANSPYQNLLHTALLVKFPASKKKGMETQPVSLTDIAPTVLAASGTTAPPTMQGVDLAAANHASRPIYAETFQNPVAHSPDCPAGCVTKVLIDWPFKYVDNRTSRRQELYDLSQEPQENHNLLATQPELARRLANRLQSWASRSPVQSNEIKKVNPGIADTLRGNGYVAR